MEVNLVNGRQGDFLIYEFLNVLLAKVGDANRLDKTLRLGIAKGLPDVLPDDGTADGGVHEVKVKVLDTRAFEGVLEVGKSFLVAGVVLELRCKEDLLSRSTSSLYIGIVRYNTSYAGIRPTYSKNRQLPFHKELRSRTIRQCRHVDIQLQEPT